MLQTETLLLIGAGALLYALYSLVLYPVFLSPLSSIPTAHWSCSISSFWILRARKQCTENRSLFEAHKLYGPVLRVAPDTLSVDGVDAMRAVYQGGFPKSSWYSAFSQYGVPNMFSTLGSKEHSRRKRMISNVYSKSYIQSSQPSKAQSRAILLGRLLPLLRQESSKKDTKGIEIQSIFMATTMDLISSYIFGIRNGTNFIQDKSYRDHWLGLYLSRHHNHFWGQELPTLTKLLENVGIRLCPSFVDDANDEIRAWNKSMCDKASKATVDDASELYQPADEPVVFRAIHAGIDKEEKLEGESSLLYPTSIVHRDAAVASEVLDQVLAGHETAGIILTYITWHLSQSKDLQAALRHELLSIGQTMQSADGELPNPKVLDSLPLLHAIVMETLRLHAPIPGPQPRETPYPSCNIGGYDIPGGVRIASLAHTLHLDERVYPDAKTWNHERWLGKDDDVEHVKEMNRQFWAFGSGGRMCIGSNFALNGIKYIIATIYSNFTTSIVNDDGIEQTDGYSSRPVGEKLFVQLTPV